ncbi:MAG: hypothetical protein CV087_07555 [Candidatus Brocadia sp. WS118]|nr:MAG: hypothetical protein CV087_07555 [Candidatus Brocadia sp. WS118]
MRKQINIKLPENLLSALKGHCKATEVSYTTFIEQAIREKLAKEGVLVPALDSGWRWDGDVEDMPFEIN